MQKRVLPALMQISNIEEIDIASKTASFQIPLQRQTKGKLFNDYETALSESNADVVYISIVNSIHAKWTEKALARGLHVIVDKPSFTDICDVQKLVDLSKKNKLCLAESTVYSYHPQIQLIKDVFRDAESKPTRLTAIFSFPSLNANNFRNKKELGGGALWDLGPYAVTPGRIFFDEEPKKMFCRISTWNQDNGIDTSFSILATYSEGRSMVGHFGFTSEYRNYLNVLGLGVSVDIERVFSMPVEMENELRVKQQNKSTILKAPKADSFLIFLQRVIESIQSGKHDAFVEDLLKDASNLNWIRKDAGEV